MTYSSNTNNSVSLADYISMNHDNIPLGHFLKFSPDNNKRDNLESSVNQDDGTSEMVVYEDANNQVIILIILYLCRYLNILKINFIRKKESIEDLHVYKFQMYFSFFV